MEFGRGEGKPGFRRCKIQGVGVEEDHVRVEQLAPRLAQVTNLSSSKTITTNDGEPVPPGTSFEVEIPGFLWAGDVYIEIELVRDPRDLPILSTAASPTRRSRRVSLTELGDSPAPKDLAHWLESIVGLYRSATVDTDFHQQAARSLVEIVGLDRGLVLLRKNGEWHVEARSYPAALPGKEYSSTILDQVVEQGLTVFHDSSTSKATASLVGVDAVVASPLFDSKDRVIGAVYGVRLSGPGKSQGIGDLEAQIVQLIATALGSSLELFEQQRESSRLRVQFEQFFSKALAQEFQTNPQLMEGQKREVTVLFCDIRGFSRLSQDLGPFETCRLLRDLMDCLTTRIHEFGGVVVDFMGDGLLAMWNAPVNQPEHALWACQAGLSMLGDLPCFSDRWKEITKGNLQIGVGINTGTVFVGNTGSSQKFKYGPLGHPVNLASRVEGATKHFGLPILITGHTRKAIGDALPTRRLCQVKVVGIDGAVDLYELADSDVDDVWRTRKESYETALSLFETEQFEEACHAIHPLLSSHHKRYDTASLTLFSKSVECHKTPPRPFDPVWELKWK